MSLSSARMPKSMRVRAWRLGGLALVFATVASTLTVFSPPAPAEAATAADFQPGFIISDDLFYDGDSMTEAQIQSFLDQRIGACLNGRCLNVLRVNLPTYPAHTSSTTGNLVCDTVQGGTNILASTVIFRVQQACNISAKVILVTLQKEQGLILSKSPSNYALNFAMGWACPDTTGCIDASSWFGYQVYRGSRQLVTYKLANFARQPGVHNIQFHPDPSCGSTPVNIRNFATAALYNYTPYQPSAAALAAFPGPAAGTCHSYGNRNFFFFYNQWFGSTFSVDGPFALNQAYSELGGAGGVLGAQVAASPCVVGNTSCWREYTNGYIGWRSNTGAYAVTGDAATAYRAAGGPTGRLGYPTTTVNAIEGPNGNGFGQNFAGGQILSSAAGAFSVTSRLLAMYTSFGWVRGVLAWPTSDQVCDSSGTCTQAFSGGYLAAPSSGAVIAVTGGNAILYRERGGPAGALGSPTSGANAITGAVGSGSGQNFRGGQMLSSATGTFVVPAASMPAYVAAGWVRGVLGWPTSHETCDGAGVCRQSFQGGVIERPVSGAPYVVEGGPIGAKYQELGGSAGPLGAPTSTANRISGVSIVAFGQNFRNGQIIATPAGAFSIRSAMLTAYSANGWVRGPLGWPVNEESCVDSTCTQQFSGGTLVRPTTGAAYVLPGGVIGAKYGELGGPSGVLGLPTSSANPIVVTGTTASGQNFQNGQIIATTDGVFAVRATVLAAWVRNGWIRGPLGWPIADEICNGSGCTQAFARGTLMVPTAGPAYVVPTGAIGEKYVALGGPTGVLGVPTSTGNPITGANIPGSGQNFQNGQILSTSLGTFALSATVLPEYVRLGWVRGSLGWPTADESCTAPGQCTQAFQFGTLIVESGASRIVR